MKIKLSQILAFLGLYFITTGISYASFSRLLTREQEIQLTSPVGSLSPTIKVKDKVDPSLPKDQLCPLNGLKYTKQEKEVWDSRRPIAVMVENSDEARPQSGLSRADVIYEALAEGWITRFMAVFYCNTPLENIVFAPVRSARTYFIDWVSEYDALYVHVGGSNRIGENANITDPRADALGQIDKFGIKDMDQFGIGYPDCYRNPDRLDHPVATEHTMVCFSENLYKIAEKRGWGNRDDKGISWDKNFKVWRYKEDLPVEKRGTVEKIKIIFAQGYDKYDAQWEYDRVTNSYQRKTGGISHLDLETGQPMRAKNVIVQLMKLTGPIDDHGHFLYDTIGTGKALIFQDGNVTTGSWAKKTRVSRTQFFNSTGKEMELTAGLTWISMIPNESQVSY